jgi:hypothetical protein
MNIKEIQESGLSYPTQAQACAFKECLNATHLGSAALAANRAAKAFCQ